MGLNFAWEQILGNIQERQNQPLAYSDYVKRIEITVHFIM
jgi:hypothetical protein